MGSSISYPAGFQHLASKSTSAPASKVPSTVAVNALLSKYVRIYQGANASSGKRMAPVKSNVVARNRPRNLSPLPMADGKPIDKGVDEGRGRRRASTTSITRKPKPVKLRQSVSARSIGEKTASASKRGRRKEKQLRRSKSFAPTGASSALPPGARVEGGGGPGPAPANVISLVFLDNKDIGLKDIHDYMSSRGRADDKGRNARDKARRKRFMLDLHLQATGGKPYTTTERMQQGSVPPPASGDTAEAKAREHERTRSRSISEPRPWQVPPASFSGFNRGKKVAVPSAKGSRRGSRSERNGDDNEKEESRPEIPEKSPPLPPASEPAIKRVTWDVDVQQKMKMKKKVKKKKDLELGRASPMLIDGW